MDTSSDIKIYETFDISDTSNIIYFSSKIALIVIVLLGFIALIYIVDKLIRGIIGISKEKFEKDDLIITASQSIGASMNDLSGSIVMPPVMQPAMQPTPPTPPMITSNVSAETSVTHSTTLDRQTKQKYEKYDEILLPSSWSPYISRDYVAYRENNNKDYISKRGGCMACQVDMTYKWEEKNYDGTKSNIIATCAYTLDPKNKDRTIWDRNKCMSECGKLHDLK